MRNATQQRFRKMHDVNGWIAGISDSFIIQKKAAGRAAPAPHQAGFLDPREDSPPSAKDKAPGEKADADGPLRAVRSGLGERVIDVFVVPPVHLCPLSLKVRNTHVRLSTCIVYRDRT